MTITLKNLFFILLLPGNVVGFFPFLIISATDKSLSHNPYLLIIGTILMFIGFIIFIKCQLLFVRIGKGTLSATVPTLNLVNQGPYKYTRNPMYVAVGLFLLGEVLLYTSCWLAIYLISILICFHLYIVHFEEARLRRDFAEKYREYCMKVPRWGIKGKFEV